MRLPVSILAALIIAACGNGAGAPFVVADVTVTAPRPGTSVSAAYLRIDNDGSAPVTLTRVASPQFERVEMHETITDDGIARMRPLKDVTVMPGETVRFERGGKHLMLFRPTEALSQVTLNFYSGDELLLTVTTTPGGS